MSIKQQLHIAVDELPESLSLEDAMERLYYAFKLRLLDRATAADVRELQAMLAAGEADITAGRTRTHADVMNKYVGLLTDEEH